MRKPANPKRLLALGLALVATNTLASLLVVRVCFAPAFGEPAALWLFLLYFGALWLSFSLAAMMEVYRLHLTRRPGARIRLARLLALGPLVSLAGLLLIPGAPALFTVASGGIVLTSSAIFSLCLLAGLWLTRR